MTRASSSAAVGAPRAGYSLTELAWLIARDRDAGRRLAILLARALAGLLALVSAACAAGAVFALAQAIASFIDGRL